MKRGYRAIERALAQPTRSRCGRAPRRLPAEDFDWQGVLERRDPVPSVLELQERFGGRRMLITGGGGSIAPRARDASSLGFRPEHITLARRPRGLADRRPARAAIPRRSSGSPTSSATSATAARLERELAAARPDVVFHLAAYKHVDWAEVFPEEFVDTNLQGSWNVLRAAEAAGVETVVVASTDKAAAGRELLRPDEAVHGAARRVLGAPRRRDAGPPSAS